MVFSLNRSARINRSRSDSCERFDRVFQALQKHQMPHLMPDAQIKMTTVNPTMTIFSSYEFSPRFLLFLSCL